MTPARPLLLLSLLAAVIAGAVTVPGPGESKLIRQRIDDLLLRRRNPAPLPVDPPSPFVVLANPGAALLPAATEPTPAPRLAEAPPGNAEQLARLASRLRITGLIRLKDQLHVIINDSPWREGDYIAVESGSGLLQLQVLRIQTGQLTLRLQDAELVMRF